MRIRDGYTCAPLRGRKERIAIRFFFSPRSEPRQRACARFCERVSEKLSESLREACRRSRINKPKGIRPCAIGTTDRMFLLQRGSVCDFYLRAHIMRVQSLLARLGSSRVSFRENCGGIKFYTPRKIRAAPRLFDRELMIGASRVFMVDPSSSSYFSPTSSCSSSSCFSSSPFCLRGTYTSRNAAHARTNLDAGRAWDSRGARHRSFILHLLFLSVKFITKLRPLEYSRQREKESEGDGGQRTLLPSVPLSKVKGRGLLEREIHVRNHPWPRWVHVCLRVECGGRARIGPRPPRAWRCRDDRARRDPPRGRDDAHVSHTPTGN